MAESHTKQIKRMLKAKGYPRWPRQEGGPVPKVPKPPRGSGLTKS